MPYFPPPSSAVPAALSPTAATAGSSGSYARGDHAHPRDFWDASDHGFLSWNYDPGLMVAGGNIQTAGTVCLAKINFPVITTVTHLYLWVGTAGNTLTSGQCFAALYNSSGTLLSATYNQSSDWVSTGLIQMALVTQQTNLSAGSYWIAYYSNGTTQPIMRAAANSSNVNANLTGANSRWATADTGRTTTMPGSLGTIIALANGVWCAVD